MIVTLKKERLTKTVDTAGWNWGAAILGPLWYIGHGMSGKAFSYSVAILLVYIFLGQHTLLAALFWFFMGGVFNKDYYEKLLDLGYKEGK